MKFFIILDARPAITRPNSNITLTPGLNYTFNQIITCTASGYPPPIINWYDSNNVLIPTGPVLQLDASSLIDGTVYICRAENTFGSDTRSVTISITISTDAMNDVLDGIIYDLINSTSKISSEQRGNIAKIIHIVLSETKINKTRGILAKAAEINSIMLNNIIGESNYLFESDASEFPIELTVIVNAAGYIINKDFQLEKDLDTTIGSPLVIKQVCYLNQILIILKF